MKQKKHRLNKGKNESTEGTSVENVGTSSRLIVKNLPSGKKTRWDEAKVRSHFSKFGTLTDVRLKLSEKTGACKFAFVGFLLPENCQKAIKAMDGAFIGGTKLTVEECKALSTERTAITKQISLNKLKKRKRSKTVADNAEEEEEDDKELEKKMANGNFDALIEEQILDTGRLFLRNLPFLCTQEQLRPLFEPFGTLAELECVVDSAGKCKGFALCTFVFPEHAVAAWKALDGTVFMGRMLHIIVGEEKRVRANDATEDGDEYRSVFQREQQQKRKENAATETQRNRSSWNALFLGTDAVAETMADNYELEKRHLLLVDGNQQNSAAVRMAMAEARLVRETRKFLSDNGVRLDAFMQQQQQQNSLNDNTDNGTKMRRFSRTTILVKNLDATREGKKEWLGSLFGRFGHVKTVLVPPEHGITALVEMANARDAKCAFEALAYSKRSSGERPLFLEWAPSNVFDEAHPIRAIGKYGYQSKQEQPIQSEDKMGEENTVAATQSEGKEEKAVIDEEEQHTKLLVRNVPFQANQEELKQLFSAFGELKFIRLPKKPGSTGHRGFCFVEFLSNGDARRAMDALMHSTHLYGRRLVLEWAKQSADAESVEEKRLKTSKRTAAMLTRTDGASTKKRPTMRSF